MELKNLGIFLIISILILLSIFLVINLKKIPHSEAIINENCIIKIELKEVRGNSLFPLIESGEEVKLFYGYYDCNDIKREEIIAYNYAGNSNPIIKIVKAIPGDKWGLEKNNDANTFKIVVNDEPLKNSQGELYAIPEYKTQILELYTKNYPVLPKNTYLLLGNQITGSLDSTRFGLIHKDNFLGKIEK